MFVLGIDPGLTTTGFGIVDQSGPAMVSVGVIRTDKAAPLGFRLKELQTDLSAIFEEFQPAVVAIERVFVNKNLHTAMSVARASGVAILVAAQFGLDVTEITPTQVKSAVCGNGAADKAQVQRMVTKRLGLPGVPQPADAADALAVALSYLQTSRFPKADVSA